MSLDLVSPKQLKAAVGVLTREIGSRSLSRDELAQILTPEQRREWLLPLMSAQRFANALVRSKILSELRIEFPSRNVVRYLYGQPSIYEIAQSINRQGYLSHYTAIHLHQLTDQIPKLVYLNVEQQLSAGGGELQQQTIDRTFKRPCRVTHNIAEYGDFRLTVLNGANTRCLGVSELIKDDSRLRITGIERTLIDAAVRPVYSGGVFEVARAYRAARGHVSIPLLVQMLQQLSYTYPYHQSIGFLLQRAGFPASEVALLRKFPMDFDFYLDYSMRQTDYNPDWRLFVPKGF